MKLTPAVLENDFVRLEPLTSDHYEPLKSLGDDPKLWAYTTIRGDGPHFDKWFDLMLTGHQNSSQISHAVYSIVDHAFAGHTSYLSIAPENARVEIGWTWYAAPFQRTKINPSCKFLMMQNAFNCGAERVELKTHGLNVQSQGAMTKMGATREGALRSHTATWRGDRRDTVFFSVLKDEWPMVEARLSERLR